MAMALDPSQYTKSWKDFLNQSSATTGRQPTPQELAAYQTAGLEAEYNQSNTEEGLAIQKQSVNQQGAYQTGELAYQNQALATNSGLDQQKINQASKAAQWAKTGAMIQSGISAPASAVSIYGKGKAAGLWGAGGTTDSGTGAGPGFSGVSNWGQASATTGESAGAGDSLLEGEAADTAFYGGGAEAGGAAAAGTGLLEGEAADAAFYGGSEIATDAAIGSAGGPVGMVVGAIVGVVVAVVSGDSVICTELHRQGILPDDIYRADSAYGKTLSDECMAGYHAWGVPLSRAMRRSRALTGIVRVLSYPVIKEMAHRSVDGIGGSRLGSLILAFGVPFCAFVGGTRKQMEVSNA